MNCRGEGLSRQMSTKNPEMCQVICQLIVCSQTAQKLRSQKWLFCAFLQIASKCKKAVDKAKKPWYNYSVRGEKPTAKNSKTERKKHNEKRKL